MISCCSWWRYIYLHLLRLQPVDISKSDTSILCSATAHPFPIGLPQRTC